MIHGCRTYSIVYCVEQCCRCKRVHDMESGRCEVWFGLLPWISYRWRRLKVWLRLNRCYQCKRRRWPWSKWYCDRLCGEECFDKWIPF